jgi:fermentation-respiration switch protein FrsA (DUF1100 family)
VVRRRVAFACLALLGVLVGVIAGSRAVSRVFLFPVRKVAVLAPPADVTVRALVASDGTPVRVLELPGPTGGRTIVDFHNNRETAESRVELARELRALGFGVVLVEYRGYGSSPGEPTEDGLYADAEAALDMLAARGVPPERVVLLGTSLGTGVAAEMARRGRGARLVLVSPYTSIPDLVTNTAPFVPASALVADHFDTLGKSGAIRIPTLIIHGDSDEIVPFAMGEQLSREIPGARLLRVMGGHHGDLFAREAGRLLTEIVRLGS